MVISIIETGDYENDYAAGKACADIFTKELQSGSVTPFYFGDIAERFVFRYGPIERGFLAGVSLSLLK